MQAAMDHAGVRNSEIRGIKTHGTGSVNNDLGEAVAIRSIFDDDIPPFTSLKRYFGHTMGGAGIVELVAFISCIKSGFIPKCLGYQNEDPRIGSSPLEKHLNVNGGKFLLNYFGFGGSAATLILNCPPGRDASCKI